MKRTIYPKADLLWTPEGGGFYRSWPFTDSWGGVIQKLTFYGVLGRGYREADLLWSPVEGLYRSWPFTDSWGRGLYRSWPFMESWEGVIQKLTFYRVLGRGGYTEADLLWSPGEGLYRSWHFIESWGGGLYRSWPFMESWGRGLYRSWPFMES